LWGVFARRKNKKALRRERVTLPDGDFLDIDWHGESQDQVTLILHGLEGSADSHYARGLMQNLNSKLVGRIGVMHFRSCSGEINRTRRFYHSGETTDLNFILQLIQQRYRNAKLTVIGISMGGNVLLKYLGETQCTRLTKAIAVSPPFELLASVKKLSRGFSRIYDQHLLKRLLKKVWLKEKNLALKLNLAEKKFKTLFEFDEYVTAPLHGFHGAIDYYHRSSCRQFLKDIKVPTLIIHAKDDPFMTPTVVPSVDELSASTQMILTEAGGHVGFVAGCIPFKPVYWLEQVIEMYLSKS